ncbi:UBIQUITIN CARBOXYL-TERMINAL HYDROLASE [Encephalitozoon cuniculi GB-M1]|uniref:ubiquitinyl hydrolase 1 n=1 Tax=Encephalitozoon cuniculi (strain GB-M1) TaxID=284813 RepID=Q8SRQ2_ENCCU|nr:uncharacterized protein ECU06_0910 [Encephalitozoon cuniculi GB-M1]CAD25451.1 UBIQUITIN CARBOXYL-TERMINAL HYDROLASE [Encephalitozoon cuniculi GB-M1]
MMAEESLDQKPASSSGQCEYAVSFAFAKSQGMFRRASCIDGSSNPKVPGPRVDFVPESVWKSMRDGLFVSPACGADVQLQPRSTGKAVLITFMIDELIPSASAPGSSKSVVVKVGWIFSILQSLINLGDLVPHEAPSHGGGMRRSRRVVNAIVDPTDRLFDIVPEIMGLRLGLDEFMRRYRVLASDGRVLHPLARLDEFENRSVLKISKITRMPDGRVLSVDDHMRSIVRGLRNQGNTCFMNSGLQCLMNCWKLSEYFISREYEESLNRHKAIHASLASAYYDLISQVYDGNLHAITPVGIRKSLGSIYEEYKGNDEQDSVEFITKMLDTLHEALSTQSSHPKKKEKEKWWEHNRSIITDLFFFCLKSTLTCRGCGSTKVSIEPAVCLSLPIPRSMQHKDNIVVFYESGRRQPVKIYADASTSIRGLKKLLDAEYGVLGKVMCIWYDGNRNMLEPADDVVLQDIPQTLFCYEYSEDIEYCWVHLKTKRLFMDKSFKFNILIKASGYDGLLVLLEMKKTLACLVSEEVRCLLEESSISSYFKLENAGKTPREKQMNFPVAVVISRAHEGKRLLSLFHDPLGTIREIGAPKPTLQHCVNRFLEKEDLHPSERLHCEGCNGKMMFSKKMDLEDLPMYLIIQLKRFQYVNSSPMKISTLIEYPLDKFLLNGVEYMVIGVCNHDSDAVTSSGHYVSYLRKNGWYLCNDQKIERVDEVDKEHTYVLFLERCS